ncbi:hypothetical protein TcasGA2_TC016354 [Tribolium castaneum]|uniref:Uncharacterized protein n=1 Tax=Tribolium castaneum TaxID=7070 RepID=D6WPB9_TRICA|nr:hypothetical protein TcasGA2_TC016354 [Tribolium castaneum]
MNEQQRPLSNKKQERPQTFIYFLVGGCRKPQRCFVLAPFYDATSSPPLCPLSSTSPPTYHRHSPAFFPIDMIQCVFVKLDRVNYARMTRLGDSAWVFCWRSTAKFLPKVRSSATHALDADHHRCLAYL